VKRFAFFAVETALTGLFGVWDSFVAESYGILDITDDLLGRTNAIAASQSRACWCNGQAILNRKLDRGGLYKHGIEIYLSFC
jgi:hypothetical protein